RRLRAGPRRTRGDALLLHGADRLGWAPAPARAAPQGRPRLLAGHAAAAVGHLPRHGVPGTARVARDRFANARAARVGILYSDFRRFAATVSEFFTREEETPSSNSVKHSISALGTVFAWDFPLR